MTNKDSINNSQHPANNSPLTTHYSQVKHKTVHSSPASRTAFTLAETLIVIGIIGVVAALTLPNLNSSTGDKEKVAKVKKIHSNLEDAFGRAIVVYGPMSEWPQNVDNFYNADGCKKIAQRIMDFLKVSKDCGTTLSPCFASSVKTLSGGTDSFGNMTYSFILADGTSVVIEYCGGGGFQIVFDIDGPNKGPNTYGKDIFNYEFYGDRDGELWFRPGGYTSMTDSAVKNDCFTTGFNCTQWILQNDNMDYLKATKGTCNSGSTVLTWTNTTCK